MTMDITDAMTSAAVHHPLPHHHPHPHHHPRWYDSMDMSNANRCSVNSVTTNSPSPNMHHSSHTHNHGPSHSQHPDSMVSGNDLVTAEHMGAFFLDPATASHQRAVAARFYNQSIQHHHNPAYSSNQVNNNSNHGKSLFINDLEPA